MFRAGLLLSSAIVALTAAAPVVERSTPAPVANISREQIEGTPGQRSLEELLRTCPARTIPTVRAPSAGGPTGPYRGPSCVQPDDLRMIDIYRLQNQARARFGALPLVWDWQMAVEAGDYARQVARTGQLSHSSRENRRMIRENLLRVPRGWSAQQMIGRWTGEGRNFVPGIYPNVSRTGNWADVAHFTAMVWPPTTNIGCALARGKGDDWLVCRYSPPGNRDGFALGLNPRSPLYCQNRGGVMMCPGPDGEDEGGQQAGGNVPPPEQPANPAPTPADGATRERPPTPAAKPDDAIGGGDENCHVGVIAKVLIPTGRKTRDGKPIYKETHNLDHGFSEVVIPFGFEAKGDFRPSAEETWPYNGTMHASWGRVGDPKPYTGTVTGDRAKLARGKWDDTDGTVTINPGPNLPTVQQHRIDAEWDPQPPTTPDKCPLDRPFLFTVTFAAEVPAPDNLDLKNFVDQAAAAGFPGTRPRTRFTTQTRSVHTAPPQPFSRNNYVNVPIGTYWDLPDDCCDIKRAKREVIQFARAAIEGPNGRQGKGWGLDILPSELEKAKRGAHDPVYTGHPNEHGKDKPEPGSAGGSQVLPNNDVLQWDAPGMPKDLFDRLHAAQGASIYRQQFLSILVCQKPALANRVPLYLDNAKVCQVAITTVRWDFPGQAGVQPVAPRPGAPPVMRYRQPRISVSFDVRDGNCRPLKEFLEQNGFLEAFRNPNTDARKLEILSEEAYRDLRNGVGTWETNPFGDVRTQPRAR